MLFNFKEFRDNWQAYIIQSLLASLTIFLVLAYLQMQHIIVVASIGASTFIVFAMPKSISAQPRNLVGGQITCILIGLIIHQFIPATGILLSLVTAGSVGLAIFLMVVLDFEHPPATATTLGIVISGISIEVAIAFAVSIIFLSLTHKLFGKFLRDLV